MEEVKIESMHAITEGPAVFILFAVVIASLTIGGVYPTAADNWERSYVGSPITYLRISSDNLIENDPEIEYFENEPPAGVPPLENPVNVYFTIKVDVPVREVTIRFEVRRIWLESFRVPEDGIVMMKFNGDWGPLPTKIVEKNENKVGYEVTVENLSLFAVVGYPVREEVLPHVLLIVAGVAVAALLYWFIVKPRKRFVSLKKLEKVTGKKVVRGRPKGGREMTSMAGHLKEAGPKFEAEVEEIKQMYHKVIEHGEDVEILKELKRKSEVGRE